MSDKWNGTVFANLLQHPLALQIEIEIRTSDQQVPQQDGDGVLLRLGIRSRRRLSRAHRRRQLRIEVECRASARGSAQRSGICNKARAAKIKDADIILFGREQVSVMNVAMDNSTCVQISIGAQNGGACF